MFIGRNRPCPCGSKKKYKRCCGKNVKAAQPLSALEQQQLSAAIQASIVRHQAKELIRVQQQGLGKPVIATKHQGHQVVAVFSSCRATFL